MDEFGKGKKIGIITARGGSKRIPRKNIKPFLGKPIIAYSIEVALASKLFDEVMVSTDDYEIANVAKHFGASVPFFRSEENSDDITGTADVITEVLKDYVSLGQNFDFACCLYPTSPFTKTQHLESAFKLLIENRFDSVFPICRFSYPILRALQLTDTGIVSMIWPENMTKRSQDLIPAYHDAGQFYWTTVDSIIETGKLYTRNSGAIVLSELEVQDIDNPSDWELAELKFKLRSSLE